MSFGVTGNPNQAWVRQQVRNFSWRVQDLGLPIQFMICDHDKKFPFAIVHFLAADGVRVIHTPIHTPVANCYAERLVESVRRHDAIAKRTQLSPEPGDVRVDCAVEAVEVSAPDALHRLTSVWRPPRRSSRRAAADDLSCRTSDELLAFGRSMEAMPQSWRSTMHPTVLQLRTPDGTMAPAPAS